MLTGKNAIITGADQGLGKDTAREFLMQGANICICSRNIEKLQNTVEELKSFRRNISQKIIWIRTDIGKIKEIEELYDFVLNEFGWLDITVNNAGIHGPIGETVNIDWEEMEHVVRVNMLGTLYSMRKAVSIYRKQENPGKIINLSGGGATAPRPNFMGYAITKTAIVRATEILAKETEKEGICINAVAPGSLNTRLLEEVLNAGENNVGLEAYQKALEQKAKGGASIENASQLIAYLASDASAGISGKLISAVWDDWKNLDARKKEIQESDIYTLRRIIPMYENFN